MEGYRLPPIEEGGEVVSSESASSSLPRRAHDVATDGDGEIPSPASPALSRVTAKERLSSFSGGAGLSVSDGGGRAVISGEKDLQVKGRAHGKFSVSVEGGGNTARHGGGDPFEDALQAVQMRIERKIKETNKWLCWTLRKHEERMTELEQRREEAEAGIERAHERLEALKRRVQQTEARHSSTLAGEARVNSTSQQMETVVGGVNSLKAELDEKMCRKVVYFMLYDEKCLQWIYKCRQVIDKRNAKSAATVCGGSARSNGISARSFDSFLNRCRAVVGIADGTSGTDGMGMLHGGHLPLQRGGGGKETAAGACLPLHRGGGGLSGLVSHPDHSGRRGPPRPASGGPGPSPSNSRTNRRGPADNITEGPQTYLGDGEREKEGPGTRWGGDPSVPSAEGGRGAAGMSPAVSSRRGAIGTPERGGGREEMVRGTGMHVH